MDQDFTLDDFREQLYQLRKLGMSDVITLMPDLNKMIWKGEDPKSAVRRILAIIDSISESERREPGLIDADARRRIAGVSGTGPDEVERFLSAFRRVRVLMRPLASMSVWDRLKLVTGFGSVSG